MQYRVNKSEINATGIMHDMYIISTKAYVILEKHENTMPCKCHT